jgi:lactoylglutathione lyase
MGDVQELRVVLTTDRYEDLMALYRDHLGLSEVGAIADGHGRVMILDAGRATLELSDVAHAEHIDDLEVGRRVAGEVRLALRVEDVEVAVAAAAAGGAKMVAPPTPTPWGSRNARLDVPGSSVQLTLFEGGD